MLSGRKDDWLEQQADSRMFWLMAAGSVLGMGVVLLRIAYTGWFTYMFLLWNLFLAWLPVAFAMLANRLYGRKDKPGGGGFLLLQIVWLFFYPNAAYMATDLIHLVDISFWKAQITLWFDLNMLVLFALLGLFLGFFSFYLLFRIWRRCYGKAAAWSFFIATNLLCSIGIYLGRFLRWNSWDLFLHPADIFSETVTAAARTMPESVGYILFMAANLLFVNGTLLTLAINVRGNTE